jgi:hypothetical protein
MCKACSMHGEEMFAYRILVRKPEWKRPLERPRHRWEDSIKTDLREINWMVWTGLIWLRIGTFGRLLWTWKWTFEFHIILGNSWVAAWLAASQEGLRSVELASWLIGLFVEAPTFSRQSAHRWRWACHLYAPVGFQPRKIPGTHFC